MNQLSQNPFSHRLIYALKRTGILAALGLISASGWGDVELIVEHASAVEGHNVVFEVTLSASSGSPVEADFETYEAGLAEAGVDYVETSGHLVFSPGQTTKTVEVPTLDDALNETDENFGIRFFNLVGTSNPTENSHGTIDDDGDPMPSLSVNDVAVPESGEATFTISLSGPSGRTVYFQFWTEVNVGTATMNVDYERENPLIWSIAAGVLERQVTVDLIDDTLDENDETFEVVLSPSGWATVEDGQGIATILDDDPLPVVSVGNDQIEEGNDASFTVSLNVASGREVSMDVVTTEGSAAEDVDYVGFSGSLSFAEGETSKTVVVSTVDDTHDEPRENFFLDLSNLTHVALGDGQGRVRLGDNDDPPVINLSDVSVVEGDLGSVMAEFTVDLSEFSQFSVEVDFNTADQTAEAGEDYEAYSGDLQFLPGETQKTIEVMVYGDELVEGDESFELWLTNPRFVTLGDDMAIGTIEDDDVDPFIFADGFESGDLSAWTEWEDVGEIEVIEF